ncbi:MAG: DegT/DnrJ/EryC1/StrS family aminotransferase, partial [Nanoarchaeota archaeon]
KKWDEIHEKRRFNKDYIQNLFSKYVSNVKFPIVHKKANPSWFGCGIICESKGQKERLVNFLESKKINTRPYFCGNILCHNEFDKLGNWRLFPNSTKALELVFFVGVAPHIETPHRDYIESILKQWTN